jgi:hypothetical protein
LILNEGNLCLLHNIIHTLSKSNGQLSTREFFFVYAFADGIYICRYFKFRVEMCI